MLSCATLWSIGGIFIKLLPWNSMVISGLRSLISGVVVLAYMRISGQKIIINRCSLTSGAAMCATFEFFVLANKLTTAANAIVLQFTAPVFILIFSAVFMHKRFGRADIITVCLTLGGIALFFLDSLTPGKLVGNLMGVIAGMCMACMYMLIGEAEGEERMSCLLVGQCMAALVGLPFLFFTEVAISFQSTACILILGIFQLGIPYILYVKSSEYCPPLACSLLGAVEPLLNPLWVFLFDGEAPGIFALFGGVVVIATITVWCIIGNKDEQKNRTSAQQGK